MFDPFENRASRDIRNQLSESFLQSLRRQNPETLKTTAAALKKKAPDTAHQNFIDERLRRCLLVFEKLPAPGKAPDKVLSKAPFHIAGLLWEADLFFECHEWLEEFWLAAAGNEKKAIQALIRTAGAFVLFEAGRLKPARSSARKAAALIRETADYLPAPFEADQLLESIEAIDQTG